MSSREEAKQLQTGSRREDEARARFLRPERRRKHAEARNGWRDEEGEAGVEIGDLRRENEEEREGERA